VAKIEQKQETGEHSNKTREFVRKNWPVALVVAGAAGAIGAAVWMTARYLREKSIREAKEEHELLLIEKDVERMTDPTVIMLESGAYLGQLTGNEAKEAAAELAQYTEDEEAKDALNVLEQVTSFESKKKR